MKVYVVTAYRWGNLEGDSYLVGVFDTEKAAIDATNAEEDWRGGKYLCQVVETEVNGPNDHDEGGGMVKRRFVYGTDERRASLGPVWD